MPPNRVQKPQNSKFGLQRYRVLADFADSFGAPMPRCSYCRDKKLPCLVSDRSRKCGSCLRVNRSSCDVHGIEDSTFRSFAAERDKLDAERAAALEQLNQAAAKLSRLDIQTRAFQERVSQVVANESSAVAELVAEEDSAAAALAPEVPSLNPPLVG